jgi:SulP family sulfate permease
MEFRVAMVATAGVLLFGILKGVLLAVIFSLIVLLKRASHPRIASLGRLPGTDRFVDTSRYSESELIPEVLVLRVESGLFYFNVENIRNDVLSRARRDSPVKLVIMDLSTSANIDLAGVHMLRELHEQLAKDGISFGLAEVHGAVRDLSEAEGLRTRVPGVDQRLGIAALIQRWKQGPTQTGAYA